jgi:Protein of unknown function (DUF4232)
MMSAAFSKVVAVCAVVAVAAAVGVASVAADSGAPPCAGGDMTGLFYGVQGSAGAGQITYALRLRNRSTRPCFVSGLPRLQLLGRTGKLLPTRVWPAHPGALAAIRVVLAPGKYAVATARFSPDVPGVGEQVIGPCELKAFRARVWPPGGGKGSFVVPITPPTPVCEKGRLVFSAVGIGRTSHL